MAILVINLVLLNNIWSYLIINFDNYFGQQISEKFATENSETRARGSKAFWSFSLQKFLQIAGSDRPFTTLLLAGTCLTASRFSLGGWLRLKWLKQNWFDWRTSHKLWSLRMTSLVNWIVISILLNTLDPYYGHSVTFLVCHIVNYGHGRDTLTSGMELLDGR